MMRKKNVIGMAATLALGLFGCVMTAQASIISETSNVNFTNDSYTLNLENGAALYSFANGGSGGFGGFNVAIKTGGSGLVASVFGAPSAYFTGPRSPFISGDLLASFTAYDAFTTIPYSSTDSYLGLAFDLSDGRHYGYAHVAGTQFLGYGYESVAGMGIQAGAIATPVPEPGSLVILAFGVALIGIGTATARRRTR